MTWCFCLWEGVRNPATRQWSLIGDDDYLQKNVCGNSSTSEPATGPVVPLFPHPLDWGGHNCQKRRTGPGITGQSPAGMDKVIFGNVTTIKGRRGCALGHGQVLAGGVSGSPLPALPGIVSCLNSGLSHFGQT